MAGRHIKRGFQTTFTNDVYHIEEQLQAYDPTLYVMYNTESHEWLIMDGVLDIAVMKLPQPGFEWLDSRVVSHMKRIHSINGFQASHELYEHEERKRKDQEKDTADLSYNLAKDSYKAVKNLAYGVT